MPENIPYDYEVREAAAERIEKRRKARSQNIYQMVSDMKRRQARTAAENKKEK